MRRRHSSRCRPMRSRKRMRIVLLAPIGRSTIFICLQILFNHESPKRPLSFVSQKIAHAAAAVSLGLSRTADLDERGRPILQDGKVMLGDLSVRRDFGYAGDYIEAMLLIVRSDRPDDYVIGSGEQHSIAEFCETAFRVVGRDWQNHVISDPGLIRKTDNRYTRADPSSSAQLGGAQRPRSRNCMSPSTSRSVIPVSGRTPRRKLGTERFRAHSCASAPISSSSQANGRSPRTGESRAACGRRRSGRPRGSSSDR